MASLRPAWPVPSRAWVERLWASIAERGQPFAAVPEAAITGLERARLLADALLSGRGEASGATLARELHMAVAALDAAERLDFMRMLAGGFTPDHQALRAAAEAYLAAPSAASAARLTEAAEPTRQELLRRMNMAPGGTAALVALRTELLGHLRREPELAALDADLRHLFVSWFNRGFLELRRIDWNTPASVLERLIEYEAVHEIQGWDDLRRRLAPDRRCFAFFHPALAGEPLIFVEVALVEGLAAAVQPLLLPDRDAAAARAREAQADTAIFYSISNCQDGLRGISFGNFLIKQVVEDLRAELPRLTRFATLSPIPGFRRWLDQRLAPDAPGDSVDLLRPAERTALREATGATEPELADAALLRAALAAADWSSQPAVADALRGPVLRACARYLTATRAEGATPDPVARFHLGNGARLERLNWLGNSAARGMQQSYGVMVNYLYDIACIEANHETFQRDGTVPRAPGVDALLAAPAAPAAQAARSRNG